MLDLDIHTRNLAFTVPTLDSLDEEGFLQKVGTPKIGTVTSDDERPLELNIPKYLVRPASLPVDVNSSSPSIKIIDYGEVFLNNNAPKTIHTPLVFRAPEAIFGDTLDHRVDLWSMGCMVRSNRPPFYRLRYRTVAHSHGG